MIFTTVTVAHLPNDVVVIVGPLRRLHRVLVVFRIVDVYNQKIEKRSAMFETNLEFPLIRARNPVLVLIDEADQVVGWIELSSCCARACNDGIAEFFYLDRSIRGQRGGKQLL